MALEIWHVGKKRKDGYETLISDYAKRLSKYTSVKFKEIKDSKSKIAQQRIAHETESIFQHLKPQDYLVLLDENGALFTTPKLAEKLSHQWMREKRTIFLVGGSYGVGDEVKARANELLGLSKLVLPHQMARLLFTEQLYRAFTILNNENYHH